VLNFLITALFYFRPIRKFITKICERWLAKVYLPDGINFVDLNKKCAIELRNLALFEKQIETDKIIKSLPGLISQVMTSIYIRDDEARRKRDEAIKAAIGIDNMSSIHRVTLRKLLTEVRRL